MLDGTLYEVRTLLFRGFAQKTNTQVCICRTSPKRGLKRLTPPFRDVAKTKTNTYLLGGYRYQVSFNNR